MALKTGTIILLIVAVILLILAVIANTLNRDLGLSSTSWWYITLFVLIFTLMFQLFV